MSPGGGPQIEFGVSKSGGLDFMSSNQVEFGYDDEETDEDDESEDEDDDTASNDGTGQKGRKLVSIPLCTPFHNSCH